MKLRDLLDLLNKTSDKIGVKSWLVGGVARDKLLNKLDKINDLDITTGDEKSSLLATELFKELQKINPGIKKQDQSDHSSIFFGNIKLDFSSNFNAPNIKQILIEKGIKTPSSLELEVYSRDFFCNSLLLGLDLKTITDLTGEGEKDIKNKVIRTILKPKITLMTNRNRVIRAIYLACKLDFEVDKDIIEFVKSNPESVKLSSNKTLTEKINESLSFNKEKTIKLITEMNLWNHIPINDELLPIYTKAIENV